MIQLKHLLVPVDFSDASWGATKYAVQLASRFGSTLHLLHVIEDASLYVPIFETFAVPSREQLETYAQDRLENWLTQDEDDGVKHVVHWRHGRPFTEIVNYADEQRIDCIVMGTHGRGLAGRALLGSVAEKVVNRAPCPVLTVTAELVGRSR
jgi:nucleotide-binding universal stress UspA family protein